MATNWDAPPPVPPKRRNAVVRLFDAPVHRDWTFWATVGWGVFAVGAIASSPSTSSSPLWFDAVFGGILCATLFGVLPAIVRLKIRRWRWRRVSSQQFLRQEVQGASQFPPDTGRSGSGIDDAPTSRSHNQAPVYPTGASRKAEASITPISSGTLSSSAVLTACRASLQYPVARSVRTLQMATDPKDQYEAILHTSEAISVTLGVTAAAWLRSESIGSDALSELQQSYRRGVSQGTWHSVIRAMGQYGVHHKTALHGSVEALRLGRGGTGLLADLRLLLEERNRWAHGARPRDKAEAATRVAQLLPPLEQALDKAQFLCNVAWVLAQGSSYRRRHGDFVVTVQRAMGDHPEFEASRMSSALPLADDTFYALGPGGPIDLTPFVVIRYCGTCMQREVCYADRLDQRHGVALKSFTSGHVIYDETLIEEMQFVLPPSGGDASVG